MNKEHERVDIRKIRDKTGMNRREFKEKFGVPERTLQDWESGKRTPPDYVIKLLYRAVDEYVKNKDN